MTRPMIRIHNIETDEVIDREMNDEEFEQYQVFQEEENFRKIAEEAKAASRQAILNRLGITEDEARLLLG